MELVQNLARQLAIEGRRLELAETEIAELLKAELRKLRPEKGRKP